MTVVRDDANKGIQIERNCSKMSLAQDTITSNTISLKGSTAIVKEFFHYSVNSILYQRGVYPPESFKRTSGYNLTMMVTTNDSLITYMNNILYQLEGLW